jgi:hypothetical protein
MNMWNMPGNLVLTVNNGFKVLEMYMWLLDSYVLVSVVIRYSVNILFPGRRQSWGVIATKIECGSGSIPYGQ